MDIYHYHPDTGILLGMMPADPNPLEPSAYLIPAFATAVAPPEPQEGFVRRFVDGVWGYSPEAEVETPVTEEPVVTGAMVNAERDRRIDAGATFVVTGYGPIPLQGRLKDQINLQARLIAAQAAKAADVTDPILILRDAADVNHMLTPDQMIDLVGQGVDWIEAVMVVSWAMKDGTAPFGAGIPADYTDDAHWP